MWLLKKKKKGISLNNSQGLTSVFPNFNIRALAFSLKKRRGKNLKTEVYKNSICPASFLSCKERKISL